MNGVLEVELRVGEWRRWWWLWQGLPPPPLPHPLLSSPLPQCLGEGWIAGEEGQGRGGIGG